MEQLKIGEKIGVIAVSMATMTFQYGGYLSFKLMYNHPHNILRLFNLLPPSPKFQC